MKAYSEYKDIEIEWVKQIPSAWEICKLKYTALGKDQCFIDGDWIESKDISTDGIRYLTSGNVGPLKYKEQGNGYITEDTFRKLECKDVYEGDILISRLNEPISRACIVPNLNSRIVTCVDNVIYRPDCNRFNKKYIVYVLNCTPYTEKANLSARGVTMHRVSRTMLGNFYIPVPSIAEQQVIASFLDAKTKPIDDIIAKREKQIELLEEMKSAIISRAVTKGLNSEAKMKDSGIEWIGEIPDHWDVKCIKYIKANVPNAFVDGPFGSNLKSQHYVEDGDVYVIESGFITSGKFEYVRDMKTIAEEHFETIKRSECKENDIIIAKIGAYFGMAAVLPKLDKKSVVSGNSLKITLDNTIMLNDIFVYLMACSKKQNGYIGVVNETAQPALSLYNLNHFKLPVAPLEEQEAIASYLDSETSKIDTRIAKRRKQIELLQEYKQALITAAVTGKIDVREYNS